MKNAVITRHADSLGRVAIPIEFRRELDIPSIKDTKAFLFSQDEKGIYTLAFDEIQPNTVITTVLGFLYIPKAYHLRECSLDLWIEDGMLRMKKTVPQCEISGETENLIRYKDTDKYLTEQIVLSMYEMLEQQRVNT